VLRGFLDQAREQDKELATRLSDRVLRDILGSVPTAWLEPVPGAEDAEAVRERYVQFLRARLDDGRGWLPA
jgi:hypothetical protein